MDVGDELLADPAHSAHEQAWVEATLTDAVRPAQVMDRLRRRFPHCVSLVFAAHRPAVGAAPTTPTSGRDDHDLAVEFVTAMRGAAPDAAESDLLRAAVDACCHDELIDR